MRIVPYLLLLAVLGGHSARAEEAPPEDLAGRIVGAALVESRAYEKLAYLSDRIGHRFSGSEGLAQAVAWTAAEMQRDGLDRVWTESVMVPRWVRGDAEAWITAPARHPISLLALGGSVATPEGGLSAEVIEAGNFEELEAAGEAVRGKIVLFNMPMRSAGDYGAGATMRYRGAAKAARQGAVGMLIRSLGTVDYRLPHTGGMSYEDGVDPIPAAAISAEDAELIHRLLASGEPVRVELTMTPKMLPDVESANVLADLTGRERPDEIVLIGAHLDTWDVGTGAIDDGAGCAIVMEAMRLLKKHGLVPKRTIRAVLFTNEENGLRGGRDYAERHADEVARHVVAIESDSGAGAPQGFGVTAGEGAVEIVRDLALPLAIIGSDAVKAGGGGADISPLRKLGVPVMNLRQDVTHYFDYHHTEADTLDKVRKDDLDRNVAAMALMAFMLAEIDEPLPRKEVESAAK